MLHAVKVEPVKLRGFSHLSGCDSLRVIGYRFTCSCGERGKVRGSMRDARGDVTEHRLNLSMP